MEVAVWVDRDLGTADWTGNATVSITDTTDYSDYTCTSCSERFEEPFDEAAQEDAQTLLEDRQQSFEGQWYLSRVHAMAPNTDQCSRARPRRRTPTRRRTATGVRNFRRW